MLKINMVVVLIFEIKKVISQYINNSLKIQLKNCDLFNI